MASTLWDLVQARSRDSDIAETIVSPAGRYTLTQIADAASRLAFSWMDILGPRRPTVAAVLPDQSSYVASLVAASLAGVRLVPIPSYLQEQEVDFIVESTSPDAVIAQGHLDHDIWARVDIPRLPSPSFRPAAEAGQIGAVPHAVGAELVLCTSGTSGLPKLVLYDEPAILYACKTFEQSAARTIAAIEAGASLPFDFTSAYGAPVRLCLMPAYSVGGHVQVIQSIVSGQKLVFLDDQPLTSTILDTVELERVTTLVAPAPILMLTVKRLQRAPRVLDSLAVIGSGGSLLAPAAFDSIQSGFGSGLLVQGYGLTETGGPVTGAGLTDSLDTRRNTVGSLLPDVDARIIDDEGLPVPAGEEGLLLIRSPMTRRLQYLSQASERRSVSDADGWFRTMDDAVMEAGQCIRITGRRDGRVNRAGLKYNTAEVENALSMHPAVRRVMVRRSVDGNGAECCIAFVELTSGASISPNELQAYCRSRLSAYKSPHAITLVDHVVLGGGSKPRGVGHIG